MSLSPPRRARPGAQARPPRRGAALLLVLVIVAILGVLAFAIVQMGSSETEAAGAKRRYDRGISCADAAREVLIGQFRTYGVSPTSLTLNQVVDDQRMSTGHYDNIAVTSVTQVASAASSSFGATDMSNRIMKAGIGNHIYRMTLVCSNASGSLDAGSRQSEVEFVVQFGL